MRRSPKPYTPNREDGADLDARTVGREAVLSRLLHRFRVASTVGTLQHSLLIGPRGAGKSHAVEVALHRLRADPSLADGFRIARIPEDVVGITSVADMLLTVVQRLGMERSMTTARRHRQGGDETGLEGLILDELGDGTLVLVIENLDRLFDGIGEQGQRSLRSWVETSRRVLIVATSPLLIDAVRSRQQPWYGSFVVEQLQDLSLDDATTLVGHLARARGGDDVAAYVESAEGRRRLAVIQQVAAGSPRLWTIFADVVTVPTLEELVPAVEDLLEELVPYYQQRLWELPANEQKIVMALASSTAAHAPARAVAELAGVDAGSAGVTLRRLEEAGWVRSEKMPGTDQRATWYELREPLFRYYLQYRQGDTRTIHLILELLHAWFDPAVRTDRLLLAEPFSLDEQYLAQSLQLERPYRFDHAYASGDPRDLVETGRLWIQDPDNALGPFEAAVALECIGIAALEGVDEAKRCMDARRLDGDVAHQLMVGLADLRPEADEADVGRALDVASAAFTGPAGSALTLVAACWDSPGSPATTAKRLEHLLASLDGDCSPRLRLGISIELGLYQSLAGEQARAIQRLEEALDTAAAVLGTDHVDTLEARYTLGCAYELAGRFEDAIAILGPLVNDRRRVLGTDHPDTLTSRGYLASIYNAAGRPDDAVALLETLVNDASRILGTDHPNTLTNRNNLGYAYNGAGRFDDAIAVLEPLVNDRTRILGTNHLNTLTSRGNLAAAYSAAGRPDDAIRLLPPLVDDRKRILGTDHPDTLTSVGYLAYAYNDAGRPEDAIALLEPLVNDTSRILGTDHPNTLTNRNNLGYAYNRAGRFEDAIALLEALVIDRTRILGADDPHTLTSRGHLASAYNGAGRFDDAIALLEALVIDRTRILGTDHADTLTSRGNLGMAYGGVGRFGDAIAELSASVKAHRDAPLLATMALARQRVRRGLQRSPGSAPSGDDVRVLLEAVARNGDAEAFARLPKEIRAILQADPASRAMEATVS